MTDLHSAYSAAHYRVFADPPFVLRAGERSPELDALLASHAADTWAFITAWNPGSVVHSDAENATRMGRLRRTLSGLTTYDGVGVDPAGEWPGEASVLVIGIPREEAVRVAAAFGQNAILAGTRGGPAELVWTAG